MWPAALKASFGGFCGTILARSRILNNCTDDVCIIGATFIIGSGLGTLETAANPYMAVTGPPKYAELRINIAQAIQAVGTVIGPVLGSYVFFDSTGDSVSCVNLLSRSPNL